MHSFGWYFLFTNVGTLIFDIGIPIVRQSLGFVIAWFILLGKLWSFLFISIWEDTDICTVVAAVFNLIFLSGSCFYVKKKPHRPQCCCPRVKNSVLLINVQLIELSSASHNR